jgi:TatD DNase family protein
MLLIDAHTHLDQYDPAELPSIFARAEAAGVAAIVCAGVTEASSAQCVELAAQHTPLYAGVGVHPSDLAAPLDAAALGRLRGLATSSPRVVCISEVGMDWAEFKVPQDVQEDALRQQVRLARELGLPVIFHSREAPGHTEQHLTTLRILAEERAPEVGCAAHYFSADAATARAYLDAGIMLSFGKPLLRLPHLQEIARWAPLDRVIVETDAYPQYFKKDRTRWTEPKDTREMAAKLAELKGLSLAAVAEAATRNTLRLLRRRITL